jgi:hypothetical protein
MTDILGFFRRLFRFGKRPERKEEGEKGAEEKERVVEKEEKREEKGKLEETEEEKKDPEGDKEKG